MGLLFGVVGFIQELCELFVGDGEFFKELVIFFDEPFAEFGGSDGFVGGDVVLFAGIDLSEIGDVAINGLWAVFGDENGF